MPSAQTFLRRFFQKATAFLASLSLVAGQAAAHAIIVDSIPAPLAKVSAGHLDVMLRYNSRIDAARSKLTLRHGDTTSRLAVTAAATPDVLRAGADVTPGDWELVWQVLAIDGHLTRGRVPFTVEPPVREGAAR